MTAGEKMGTGAGELVQTPRIQGSVPVSIFFTDSES